MSKKEKSKIALVMVGYYVFYGVVGYLGRLAANAIIKKIAE